MDYSFKLIPFVNKVDELSERIQNALATSKASHFLFWDDQLGSFDQAFINQCLQQHSDIFHGGLKLGLQGLPNSINYVSPTWTLNCDPDSKIEASSWRMSFRACLIRREVFSSIGNIDTSFFSVHTCGLEWGYRCIQNGVIMRHHPGFVKKDNFTPVNLTQEDELRFLTKCFSKKWLKWSLFRMWWSNKISINDAQNLWNEHKYEQQNIVSHKYQSPSLQQQEQNDLKVTILIPTIDRYKYLFPLLDSLKDQTTSIHEIIVIDQTPNESRQHDYAERYSHLPLKVIYQDITGQCCSRNAGLEMATGDAILFIDDDDEIENDLIEKHLKTFQTSHADASCGVADEADAGPLPEEFKYTRLSDVFPTNNTLLKRNALKKSGLFDLAYNKGSRADGDLGMRLYLSGALLVLQPHISVLHHHAPMGGLRTHKARVITYASSRKTVSHRRLLSKTELYLAHRYFNEEQCRELIWQNLFSTFAIKGSKFKKLQKVFYGSFKFRNSLKTIREREKEAKDMLKEYPQIPTLKQSEDEQLQT